ncbi:MAG: hypothetical protein Q7T03_10055 [Deltaproteobacteria bacterium]|nr:hypothetical protein [Deltaproteobacteria bacterium]
MSRRFLMLFLGCLMGIVTINTSNCFAGMNAEMECCKIFSHPTLNNPYNSCCEPQNISSNPPIASERFFSIHGFQADQTQAVFLRVHQLVNLDLHTLAIPDNEHWGGSLKHPLYIQNAHLLF